MQALSNWLPKFLLTEMTWASRQGQYLYNHLRKHVAVALIPFNDEMCPTVIDKIQPIESIGSRARNHTRTFVRARSNSSGLHRWKSRNILESAFTDKK